MRGRGLENGDDRKLRVITEAWGHTNQSRRDSRAPQPHVGLRLYWVRTGRLVRQKKFKSCDAIYGPQATSYRSGVSTIQSPLLSLNLDAVIRLLASLASYFSSYLRPGRLATTGAYTYFVPVCDEYSCRVTG